MSRVSAEVERPEHRTCRERTDDEAVALAALLWCSFCQQLVHPEWRTVAGHEVAMHRHGDSWHGCHRVEVEVEPDGTGTAVHAYEVVIRQNGQYQTLEPGDVNT